jgi:hypothetical protein
LSRAWPVAVLTLAACSSAKSAAPDGGELGHDLWSLATAWSLADTKEAAERVAADLRGKPPEPEPPPVPDEAVPLAPRAPAPRTAAAPAPLPGAPAPDGAPREPQPPSCNDWKTCNALVMRGKPVPVSKKAWPAPQGRGGAIAGGVYDLVDAIAYVGLLGSSGLRGDVERAAIAFPPFEGPSGQVLAQEVMLRGNCTDTNTLSVDIAGGTMSTAPICTSSPCSDCGGKLSYTSAGDVLQLIYPGGEVDTFERRPDAR